MAKSNLACRLIHLWVLLAGLDYNGLTGVHVRIHDHPRVGLHHSRLAIGLLILHLGGHRIVVCLETGLDRVDTSLDYMNTGFGLIMAIMVLVMPVMMLAPAMFNPIADR